ncbi:MAG: U32 family peptidase [Acidaminococcales bacterium]|nr:U32 family peptidase [Acidaminococcales bacterium]
MSDLRKPELLAPAGNMEKLEIAFLYGADAVYLAGENFGMRARGGNFSEEELTRAINLARVLKRKIYIAVNIMPRNAELEYLPEYLIFLRAAKPDALIVSDLGVWRFAREYAPDIPLHVSTQASAVNWACVQEWGDRGAARVVLARELSLAEITQIRRQTAVEIEVFIHGAMCIAYSGRCLLSSYLTGRDANRGLCAQVCRWRFGVSEEKRPGEYFPLFEEQDGTYVFNSRDLCLLACLPQLMEAGVDSFKIEGRMKSIHYVATAVSVYRQAIDCYFAEPGKFTVKESWLAELAKISHRPYTEGFIAGNPYERAQEYTTSSCRKSHDFVGLVRGFSDGFLLIEQRNNLRRGERVEVLQPDGKLAEIEIAEMFAQTGEAINAAAHPGQLFRVPCLSPFPVNSLLRREHDS